MENIIFQGTEEKHKGLQIVDININFDSDIVNKGFNSFVIKDGNIKYKNIHSEVYLNNGTFAWGKCDVFFRDLNGNFFSGTYTNALEISSNKLTEYYSF